MAIVDSSAEELGCFRFATTVGSRSACWAAVAYSFADYRLVEAVQQVSLDQYFVEATDAPEFVLFVEVDSIVSSAEAYFAAKHKLGELGSATWRAVLVSFEADVS